MASARPRRTRLGLRLGTRGFGTRGLGTRGLGTRGLGPCGLRRGSAHQGMRGGKGDFKLISRRSKPVVKASGVSFAVATWSKLRSSTGGEVGHLAGSLRGGSCLAGSRLAGSRLAGSRLAGSSLAGTSLASRASGSGLATGSRSELEMEAAGVRGAGRGVAFLLRWRSIGQENRLRPQRGEVGGFLSGFDRSRALRPLHRSEGPG
jgi:hypothetical protein